MNLICQNIPQLTEQIRKFGCRFRCLQSIAEIEEQKALTAMQINECYEELTKDSAIMNKNCLCGMQEHLITNMSFRLLGNFKKNCRQVGMMYDHSARGWDGKPVSFEFIIFHWKTLEEDGHYTLADKNGTEIFDPWNYEISKLTKLNIKRKLLYKIWRH